MQENPMTPSAQQMPIQQNPLMGQPQPQPGAQQGNMLAQPIPPTAQQLDDAIKHNAYMADILSTLLAKPDVSSKDVLNGITDAMRNKTLTPQQAAKEAANVPTDPAKIKPFLMQHFIQNLQTGKQVRAMRMTASG